MRFDRVLLLASLLLAFCAAPLPAQTTAAISGFVPDSSGAPVTAAEIRVKDLEPGAIRRSATNEAGRYVILSLSVGTYEVTAAKAAFQTATQTGIHLAVGQEARVDLALHVGTLATQVSVNSDAPIISTTTSDIS